jgi:hypothetical protein
VVYDTLSIVAEGKNWGGQAIDTVETQCKDNADVMRLVQIWKEWHLNDVTAGTDAQMQALKNCKGDYTEQCNVLKSKDLHVDRGYEYGTQWLVKVLPAEIKEEVMILCTKIKGSQ